ncbi:MAG: hypothetical protein H0V65_05000 [Chitinophagales bacterium]|jgi:hypothetical protein|nr:hypothetical protein [Chitinophagales bacterium]
MNPFWRIFFVLAIFSIAMGFLEAAVVIYLRELYYPEGFKFPLSPIPPAIAGIELLREAAAIIMLLAIGIIAGKNAVQRFSFFIFCFGAWDIFYYIFLKLFLDWPDSLFTWDILFLIPVPWIGPVIAPCILSMSMILLTLLIAYYYQYDLRVSISKREWLLLIAGAVSVIFSFMWDYIHYLLSNKRSSLWTPLSQEQMFNDITGYVPQSFNWTLFTLGELLLLLATGLLVNRHNKLLKLR